MPTQQASLSHADLTNDAAPFAESRAATATGGGKSAGCDLSALRLVAVPDTGPPFDGDPPTGAPAPATPLPYGSGWANLGQTTPARGDRPDDGAHGADRGGASGDDWSRQFALLLTEALAGARPIRQILPWTTDRARTHLDKLMPLFSGGQRPRVQRVITSRPTKDAIEMTVVVGVGTRTRALAVRLERVFHPQRGMPRTRTGGTPPQWLCTAIEAA